MDLFDILDEKIKREKKQDMIDHNNIEKNELTRKELIRVNSYIGSRLNTDLRGVKYLEKKELTDKDSHINNEKIDLVNHSIEEIQVEQECEDKLLIIDGSSLLSTSFFATARDLLFSKTEEQKEIAYTKLMQTKDGIYTNGIYMFFKVLLPIIKNQKITHLAVVLDKSRNTFRREIFEDYKANRKETPHPLKSQFKLISEILRDINVAVFSNEYYEADDFAGSISTKFENDINTILHTKDEDYIQLVTSKTKLWMVTSKCDDMYKELNINKSSLKIPSGIFEYTPDYVRHFKGIDPIQIIDAKAIEGDKSDNIKGVKNVGETSSRPLLREYKSLEGIYEVLSNLNETNEKELATYFKESLGIKRSPIKNLITYKDDAFLSKQLATIKTDIEEIQDLNLESLRLSINIEAMHNKFKELEMNSLLSMIPKVRNNSESKNNEEAFCPF